MQNMTQNYFNPSTQFYNDRMRAIAGNYNNPYPQQYFNQSVQQPSTNQMPCRPVTSLEEARAAIIDNPLVAHVFTNFGNNEIYTKHILNDGTAKLNVFKLVNEQSQTNDNKNVMTGQETPPMMSNEIEQMKTKINELNSQIIQLNEEIVNLKKGGKSNDEPSKSSSNTKNGK